MSKRQEIFFRQIVAVCDLVTLVASYAVAYWVRDHFLRSWYGELFPFAEYVWILWIIVPTWLSWLRVFSLNESVSHASLGRTIIKLFKVQVLAGLALLSVMYLTRSAEVSRLLLQTFLVVSFIGLVAERTAVKMVLDYFRKRQSLNLRRVLVIGTNSRAERYLRLLHDHPHWGTDVMGFISSNGVESPQFCGKPVLGQLMDLSVILREHVVDEVLVASPWGETMGVDGLAMTCAERGIAFRTLVEMPPARVGSYNVEDLGMGLYLLSLETIPQETPALLIKRLLDIIGASVGLILFGLAYLWYGPKIHRESPGPVLFHQTRVGQNGRLFTFYKFRTMYLDAEKRLKELLSGNEMKGYIFKIKDDPRLTPTGRLLRHRHIDELPQFWNALKGEISLVGTRPPTPNEVAQYLPHHSRRLSMKPGITGLWQLNGNGAVNDFEDIVRLDCEYIDKWSLWLDCKIMAKTVMKVMRGEAW